jgi:hypothetical protein
LENKEIETMENINYAISANKALTKYSVYLHDRKVKGGFRMYEEAVAYIVSLIRNQMDTAPRDEIDFSEGTMRSAAVPMADYVGNLSDSWRQYRYPEYA